MFTVFYGAEEKITVTETAVKQGLLSTEIPKSTTFNAIFGDVAPNKHKHLTIKFNDDQTTISLPEIRQKGILIKFDNVVPVIPKMIMQYWDQGESSMPDWAVSRSNQIQSLHKDFGFELFDYKKATEFIKTNFHKEVSIAFRKCNVPAMRCDLFRYCYLYVNGGFYFDLKTVCARAFLDEFVVKSDIEMVLLKRSHEFLFNGFIGSQAKTKVLQSTIDECVENILSEKHGNHLYLTTGTPVFTKYCKEVYGSGYESIVARTIDYEDINCPLTFAGATYDTVHWSDHMKQTSIYRRLELRKLLQVDNVFLLNLKKRPDRLEECRLEFKKLLIDDGQWERFEAVLGADAAVQEKYKNEFAFFCKNLGSNTENKYLQGGFGCLLSHLGMIMLAKQRNYKRVLFLEDDFETVAGFDNEEILSQIGALDFDMFYLSMSTEISPTPIGDGKFCKVNRALSTGAYIINHTIYDAVIDGCLQYGKQIDVFFADVIQKHYTVLSTPKCLIVQRAGFSDIVQQNITYRFDT